MKLKVLGSSSNGNCYILDNGHEALIIEAGVHPTKVKQALDYNIRKVMGCLITHQHNDHAKYLKVMCDLGFTTLAPTEVYDAKNFRGHRSLDAQPMKRYTFGQFKVMPFPACHDVPCVGYLVSHPEIGKLMFLTDSYMCEYTFKDLNHVLIECNYTDGSLLQAIIDGRTRQSQRDRLMESHMELESCKGVLLANDLSQVSEIVLLHLSDNNSDEEKMVSTIEGATGKAVYAARPGLTIEIGKL